MALGQKRPHRFLGPDRPARPREELDAEFTLELADRLRQGRLRDVQALGRMAEMNLFVDGEEVPELAKVDSRKRCRH
jgi:hypothetical protein